MMPVRVYLAVLLLCACGTTRKQVRPDETPGDRAVARFDPKGRPLDEAEGDARRARAHELEAFELEVVECADPLVDGRGVCSLLGPATEIRDIEDGVLIRFGEGVEPSAIAEHLRCRHSWVGLESFHHAGGCPLDLAGVRFEVVGPAIFVVGPAILVLGDDEKTVDEIRRRARMLSMRARRR